MTKAEIEARVREFTKGGDTITINLAENNVGISLSVDFWIAYICQILNIPEEETPVEEE